MAIANLGSHYDIVLWDKKARVIERRQLWWHRISHSGVATLWNHSFLDHIQTQMLREFFSDYSHHN